MGYWKKWWQSATLWFNGMGLGLFFLSPEIKSFVCENTRFAATVFVLDKVVNIVLRFKTNSAIKLRSPEETLCRL